MFQPLSSQLRHRPLVHCLQSIQGFILNDSAAAAPNRLFSDPRLGDMTNMSAEAYIADAELEKQITALQIAEDPVSQARALALLTVLLSRCSEDKFATVAGCVSTITELATASADQLVQVTEST